MALHSGAPVTDEVEPVERGGAGVKLGSQWTPEECRRIDAILQEAIPLSPAERDAFLSRVCKDPEERRTIERLLELHDRLPARDGDGAPLPPLPLPERDYGLSAGDRLGPYEIVKPLGRGGMGHVYLARDPNLGRLVAIKLLSPELARDSRQRDRLRNEARAAAKVAHPNIAHVYALEEHDRGTFIVSEYIDGHTLREEVEKGALPPALAVSTVVQIARAVGAAHDQQIVHRDLKPENVMRTRTGDVKVLDFGLALSLSANTRLTATGVLLGTLVYMSPEQLRGEEAVPASDIFALGLMLHELMSGEHAFEGKDVVSRMTQVLSHEPRALPREVSAAAPLLPGIIRKCLAKAPADRYGSMGELVAELESVTTGVATPRPASGALGREVVETFAESSWKLHQAVISVVYPLTLVAIWFTRPGFQSGWPHAAFFVAAVVAAALNVTLRLHLVFAARMGRAQLGEAIARARPLVRLSDWAMSALLLVGAGLALVGGVTWNAAVLAALAVCNTVAFLVIEPGTEGAAFREDDGSGVEAASR